MADQVRRKTRWGRWLLVILFGLLAVGYSVLWFVTKPLIEDFADNWIADQRKAGFEIKYSDRRVEGFPLNFKLVIDDPEVKAPGNLAEWKGEQLRLHSRPWNFYPMLANWWGQVEGFAPGKSTLRDQNGDTHQIDMNAASRLLVAWDSENLTRANLKLPGLSAVIDGEKLNADDFVFAVTPSANLKGAFDFNLSWDSIDVPGEWLATARNGLSDAPPAAVAIASGILDGLETGKATNIPMPNALLLGDQPRVFGLPLN